MSNAPLRFGRLAAEFELMVHNLSECQNPRQRRELLKGMMGVLNQIVDILYEGPFVVEFKVGQHSPVQPAIAQGRPPIMLVAPAQWIEKFDPVTADFVTAVLSRTQRQSLQLRASE